MSEPTDARDPFESLRTPVEAIEPRPAFARSLRDTVVAALTVLAEVPLVDLPERTTTMSRSTTDLSDDGAPASASSSATGAGTGVTTGSLPAGDPARTPAVQTLAPYLTVHDGPAALAFYAVAFGAGVALRIEGPDGSIGHAELVVGATRFFLSDEAPDRGVLSPRTLGGTSVGMHLAVDDVDASVARAEAAGAQVQRRPEDMAYGQRQGVLVDPFGHRWLLTQHRESVGVDELVERMGDLGDRLGGSWIEGGGDHDGPSRSEVVARNGRIWPAVACMDAPAMIRLAVDVLGFTEQVVVRGEGPGEISHSQLAWPEGGVVQIATADRQDGNPFSQRPIGSASIYVVTDDPMAVHRRCVAAGLEIIREPEAPHYDPDGSGFGMRDPEGNLWSFGTYPGA